MAFRWAAASERGSSHEERGERLQDAYAVWATRDGRALAVVSDGAGSAAYGHWGAWLACRQLKSAFRGWSVDHEGLPSEELLMDWLDDVRDLISLKAQERETQARDFAATLALLLVSEEEEVTLHIGDSAIVGRARDEEQWDVLCWPENGEYASSTYFLTDDPVPQVRVTRSTRNHDSFALFSDGIGDLALVQAEKTAHSGFFRPMMRHVDALVDDGRSEELSQKLRAFLGSDAVRARSDDDVTLVLLSDQA